MTYPNILETGSLGGIMIGSTSYNFSIIPMAILNYTTKVDSMKTVGEIMVILSKLGASDVMIRNSEFGAPIGVGFAIWVNGQLLNFRLPCNVDGVLKQLQKDPAVPRWLSNRDQAQRVGWRIVKDWTEAQVAIIQAGLVTVDEVFMPYLLNEKGQTLHKMFTLNPGSMKLLNAG